MSPRIEIKPAPGEKPFAPIIVDVSKKLASEIAVDITMAPVLINQKESDKDKEKRSELAVALVKASKQD